MARSMFRPKSVLDRRIFFPWEGRGTLRQYFSVGRVGPVVLLSGLLSFVLWVGHAEQQAAGERLTLLAISRLRGPVERFLLAHEGRCPSPSQLQAEARLEAWPVDGWGKPIRLVCPSEREDSPYLLMSDGPDGEPGGLDRIEY